MERAAVHKLLVRARNELDRRGLAKGTLQDVDGHVCIRGAIHRAVEPYTPDLAPRVIAADRELSIAAGAPLDAASGDETHVQFNNHPNTTKEDVLALFDRAIAATAPEPEDIELTTTTREPDLIPA